MLQLLNIISTDISHFCNLYVYPSCADVIATIMIEPMAGFLTTTATYHIHIHIVNIRTGDGCTATSTADTDYNNNRLVLVSRSFATDGEGEYDVCHIK